MDSLRTLKLSPKTKKLKSPKKAKKKKRKSVKKSVRNNSKKKLDKKPSKKSVKKSPKKSANSVQRNRSKRSPRKSKPRKLTQKKPLRKVRQKLAQKPGRKSANPHFKNSKKKKDPKKGSKKSSKKKKFAFRIRTRATRGPRRIFSWDLKKPQRAPKSRAPQSPKLGSTQRVQLEAQIRLELEQEITQRVEKELRETLRHQIHEEVQIQVESPVEVQPPQTLFSLQPYALESSLSTQDLLKPNDPLRQSIEGFLMDQRSPHTRKAYGKDLKRFVKFLHSRNLAQGMEKLNRTVLISYKESLISEGLEHTTIDRHIATLRSFFNWLVDDGLLLKSPADGVRFLNPKRISRTIGFSDEEVKKLLTIPNLHTRAGSLHYAILMVLFYCGLRRSELCSLKTTHLGTERNQRVIRLRGKGNAERLVVMVLPVWNAIQHYFYIARRSLTDDVYLFTPNRNNRTGVLNKPLDTSMIFYIVTRYAKLAGIVNRVSPHSCRATAISNARDHNVPDRAIQEFAGWASPDMITRYDKRKSSVENSAAHSIVYGSENRSIPMALAPEEPLPSAAPPRELEVDSPL